MFLFKKKFRPKKSKYKIRLRDYQVTVIMNFISEVIVDLKKQIEDEEDYSFLYSAINEKYSMMEFARQLGFSEYEEELKTRKPVEKEIKAILEKRIPVVKEIPVPVEKKEKVPNLL